MGIFSYSVIDMLVKPTLKQRLQFLFCKHFRIKAVDDDCSEKLEIKFNEKPHHKYPQRYTKVEKN